MYSENRTKDVKQLHSGLHFTIFAKFEWKNNYKDERYQNKRTGRKQKELELH